MNSLIVKIIEKLKRDNKSISFAESCTGGRIAVEFTAVSGASTVLNGSCVTYSNEIKHEWLKVKKDTLDKFGAVSKECVSEMVEGIKKMSKSDYAIAVSGIAGPTGGSALKPVGTVYIALLTPTSKEVFHCLFEGDREQIQVSATQFSIEKLVNYLEI
ncbi:Molybdopterin binding motif, CinA N-terminal domain / C-terminal domain of CinA type S [hydrothermal vent metagenome]|uniref:Molybdopterin binding motif, CinA N-terminal domain / C-terminal domain of CinA type S n=1 Tax=hydrothermal vent metagenome TaxID=652676 RepID=A0A1W1EDE1_9ZZZZ